MYTLYYDYITYYIMNTYECLGRDLPEEDAAIRCDRFTNFCHLQCDTHTHVMCSL